jgi:hypothetical protein
MQTSNHQDDAVHQTSFFQQQPVVDPLLPKCEDLMEKHHFLRDGAFLTRQGTQVAWKLRRDGSRELTLPHLCELKRYTANEARQCLAHKHILMIGDSLTRYQSLALMFFLEHGEHPTRFGHPKPGLNCTHVNLIGEAQCSVDVKNVCLEAEYGNWPYFHQQLGDISGPFRGHLECSCARAGGVPTDTESLLYANHEVRVTHLSETGWDLEPKPLYGFQFKNCSASGSCKLSVAEMDANLERSKKDDYDWNTSLSTGFDLLTDKLGTIDITLYNRGNWNQITTAMAKDLMPKFRDLARDRCFYKSTTQSQRTRERPYMRPLAESDRVFVPTLEAGCGYLDFAHLTSYFEHFLIMDNEEVKTIFWDSVHYTPWVYEELNNLLLNVLCNVS